MASAGSYFSNAGLDPKVQRDLRADGAAGSVSTSPFCPRPVWPGPSDSDELCRAHADGLLHHTKQSIDLA